MLETKYVLTALFVCFVLFSIHLSAAILLEERRFSIKKTVILWLTAGIVFFLVVYLCYSLLPSSIRLAVSLLVAFLYFWATFIYASADGLWKKCYLWVTYGTVFCILWPFSIMFSKLFTVFRSDIAGYFIRAVIQFCFCMPLLLAYRRYLRSVIKEVSGFCSSSWMRLFLSSIIWFSVFLVFLTMMSAGGWSNRTLLLIYSLCILAYIASSMVCISTIYYMRKEGRDEAARKNAEYMASYVEAVRQRESETRRIRHDIRHHNEHIASLARKGDTQAILNYLGKDDISEEKRVVWCPHIVVNGILSSYALKASERGIAFSASADTPSVSPISDVDYVAILSNLLENAINATGEISGGGTVTADIRSVGEKTVIVVTNPSSPIKLEDGLPVNRSIGIDSIITSSRKYNGEVNYKLEGNICSCCVVLNP